MTHEYVVAMVMQERLREAAAERQARAARRHARQARSVPSRPERRVPAWRWARARQPA